MNSDFFLPFTQRLFMFDFFTELYKNEGYFTNCGVVKLVNSTANFSALCIQIAKIPALKFFSMIFVQTTKYVDEKFGAVKLFLYICPN